MLEYVYDEDATSVILVEEKTTCDFVYLDVSSMSQQTNIKLSFFQFLKCWSGIISVSCRTRVGPMCKQPRIGAQIGMLY